MYESIYVTRPGWAPPRMERGLGAGTGMLLGWWNVLELEMGAAQLHECSKNHGITHFQMVNCMLCIFTTVMKNRTRTARPACPLPPAPGCLRSASCRPHAGPAVRGVEAHTLPMAWSPLPGQGSSPRGKGLWVLCHMWAAAHCRGLIPLPKTPRGSLTCQVLPGVTSPLAWAGFPPETQNLLLPPLDHIQIPLL